MIPSETKAKLSADPFMHKCCLADENCQGRIQWHHNLIWKGQKQQEWWSILPLCVHHHEQEGRRDIKSHLNQIMRDRSGGAIQKYERFKKFV